MSIDAVTSALVGPILVPQGTSHEIAEVVSEAMYPWFVVLGEHENVPVAYAETAVSLLEKRRS